MAKRFTDTDKWKKPLIRSLEAPYKLLYLYLYDDCDHAGLWQVDEQVAELRTGVQIDWKNALDKLSGLVIKVSDDRWFIPEFIEIQYGVLNPANRAHASAMALLEKFNLLSKNKVLISPLQGAKDKDKDKDKDKGGVGEKKTGTSSDSLQDLYPFFTPDFEAIWNDFIELRKKKRKPLTERAVILNLNSIQRLCGDNSELAVKICEQTIARGWDGFFELKEIASQKPDQGGYTIGGKYNPAV